MKLSELLKDKKLTTTKGASSARGEACQNICEFLNQDLEDSFMYWMGRTKQKGMTAGDIHDMIKKAKREGREPVALFKYLMKQ